jgi:hypothetical protein
MNTIKVANESGRNQFVWCEKHRRYYIFCDVYRTCTTIRLLKAICPVWYLLF